MKSNRGEEGQRRAWTRSVYSIFRNTRGEYSAPTERTVERYPELTGREVLHGFLARVDASIDQCQMRHVALLQVSLYAPERASLSFLIVVDRAVYRGNFGLDLCSSVTQLRIATA